MREKGKEGEKEGGKKGGRKGGRERKEERKRAGTRLHWVFPYVSRVPDGVSHSAFLLPAMEVPTNALRLWSTCAALATCVYHYPQTVRTLPPVEARMEIGQNAREHSSGTEISNRTTFPGKRLSSFLAEIPRLLVQNKMKATQRIKSIWGTKRRQHTWFALPSKASFHWLFHFVDARISGLGWLLILKWQNIFLKRGFFHEGLIWKSGNLLTFAENFENLSHRIGHRIWELSLRLNQTVVIPSLPHCSASPNPNWETGRRKLSQELWRIS